MDFDLNKITNMIPKIGITKLKDLIKAMRACKTAADERAVIAKESAAIRTAFKEENNETRYINIAKLLYIHMLGYPAHFGQIECLKLAASPQFADKRLAYLGIMLLLDENQETLTLVTNCLKNDMNSSNTYIVGLALSTLGNIASAAMARDLSSEVERLLGNSNSYVRKKAALCAVRCIRKVPYLTENFIDKALVFLNERSHGVLLTGTTLLEEICLLNPELIPQVRQTVPTLVRLLKSLITAGSSPEHDVNGITDPFLQVKILSLLRILGKGDVRASESMNDTLAQVATSTEASKNVGNAILYEAVMTIMNIESDSSLRVLGINILGRFLSNKDNNIKYVALTTLTKTAQTAAATDASALQRHRSTILDCLRDPDVSIRRRALDLSFFLINSTNIRILTRELLSFLEVCESDIKATVASRICGYAGRFRPNKRWEIDTVTRVLRVAGSYVDQSVINHFVKLVSTGDQAVHQYSARKLYSIIKNEGVIAHTQEGLLQAAFWTIGEYGDVLVNANSLIVGFGGEEDNEGEKADSNAPTEEEVFGLLTEILRGPYATKYVKEYGITALAKLVTRFSQPEIIKKVSDAVNQLRTNFDYEIQQRAVEYSKIFELDKETRYAILERMPELESAAAEEALKGTGTELETKKAEAAPPNLIGDVGGNTNDVMNMVFGNSTVNTSKAPATENIMDLLGSLNIGGNSAPSAVPVQAAPAKPTNNIDLLGDLFGSSQPVTVPVNSSTTKVSPIKKDDPLGNLLSAPPAVKSYECYNKNGFQILFEATKESPSTVKIQTTFKSDQSITGITFQVAVPKTLKLMMQAASANQVSPGNNATQIMKIENPTKVPIRLRVKIGYITTSPVEEIIEFSSFDPSLWTE